MWDEKTEKSKRYTWHLLYGIQGNVFLSSFSLFLRCSSLRLNFVPFEKVRWCPAKIRQNLFNIYAETLASRFALLLEKEGMMSKFHKSQSKVIDRRPNWRKKYKKKNDKTLTNKHFILKIVSRLTTLCLNNTWYFGWGTPSFTIFDSYLICWLHWEKKYIIPARSLVEISESAYRVYRS